MAYWQRQIFVAIDPTSGFQIGYVHTVYFWEKINITHGLFDPRFLPEYSFIPECKINAACNIYCTVVILTLVIIQLSTNALVWISSIVLTTTWLWAHNGCQNCNLCWILLRRSKYQSLNLLLCRRYPIKERVLLSQIYSGKIQSQRKLLSFASQQQSTSIETPLTVETIKSC